MRSETKKRVCAVVCCLLTTAAVQAQTDSNTPWDPADHLAIHWTSVYATARIYNPAEYPDRTTSADKTLTVSGEMDILDANGLIGLSMTSRQATVFDQDGNEIYGTPDSPSRTRFYRAPRTRPVLGPTGGIAYDLHEYFSVNLPMDPNLGYPTELSRLEYTADALVADKTQAVDIPLVASEEWVEVVPGLQVLIEEATVGEGSYQYRAKFEYDPNLVSYGSGATVIVHDDDTLPAMVMAGIDILDAEGNSVRDRSMSGAFGGSTSSHSSGGLVTGTASASGSCSACGDAAIIRYVFAVAPYQQKAQFVLENIPVPSF